MKLSTQQQKIIRWTARILSIIMLLFLLPFYFGYGNPLPFINPEYTAWDNTWLSIFPLMFIGLILGWRYKKLGGYLVIIPLGIGMLFALLTWQDFAPIMLIPFLVGILYLIDGYHHA